MCFKNKEFSESFGQIILRGIFKSNSEHITQYLDNLTAYLAISDEFSHLRIEWMFGYATLKINMSSNSSAGNDDDDDQSISGEYASRPVLDE